MTTGGRSQLIIFGPSDLSDSDNSDYSFFTMSLFTSIYSFRNKKRNRDKNCIVTLLSNTIDVIVYVYSLL